MKRYIYILLATALAALTGCIKDKTGEWPGQAPDGSVNLTISKPAPVARNMGGTRAGVNDFNEIKDLNVIIAEGSGDGAAILWTTYFDPDGIADGTAIDGSGDHAVTYHSRGDDFGIHFSKNWLDYYEIPSETATFFLVANYGSSINATTVGALRDLKDDSVGLPGSVGSRYIMFGESEDLPANDPAHTAHVGEEGHENGRSLKLALKRTAAMITVKIDGSGLADGSGTTGRVVVTPLSISLHNVPAWCYLGKENVITTTPGGVTPIGGAVAGDGEAYYASDLGWGMVASSASGVANTSPVVGAHYTDAPASAAAPDYLRTDVSIMPLFLFENLHGGNGFGAPNDILGQVAKRPAAATGTSEADIDAVAGACSYLTVRARYQELDADLRIIRGGEVMYRVFLGADVWQNFDVERNTYYRLTLVLNNTAVGEGNASWRLEHGISDQSMLSESDFTLNAAGEMIIIDELITKLNANMEVEYTGNDQQQANGSAYMSVVFGGWRRMPLNTGRIQNGVSLTTVSTTGDSQFRLWVDAMDTTDGVGANTGYVRQVTFHFLTNSGHYTGQDITITQFGPMVIEVNQGDARLTQPILDQLALAGKSLPLVIYLDRVDRDAMPWGFGGETITNQGSGYDNGLNLIDNHQGAADDYLPFGKPLPGATEASAMMHAAFLNYYQWNGPEGFTNNNGPTPGPTMTAIRFDYANGNPTGPVVPNTLPTRAEWRLLEMLDQAGFEVFDGRHEPLPWINYWTSDAVEEGSSQSWAYRIGGSNGDSTEAVDRTTPVRYRMVHFQGAD